MTEALSVLGCKFIRMEIDTIQMVIDRFAPHLVVNCLGLGNKDVTEDKNMYPIRGLIARFKPATQLPSRAIIAEHYKGDLVFIVSRPDQLMIGGSRDEGNYSQKAENSEIDKTLKDGLEIVPELGKTFTKRND